MKKIFLPVAAIVWSMIASAQQKLPVDVIQVVKDFDARLDETEKIKINPELIASDTTKKSYQYTVNPGVLDVKYAAPQIRPVPLKPADPLPVYPFYLKAGYGMPGQAYGKMSYGWNKNDRAKIGFDLSHHSANNSKKNKAQKFYDNDIKANALFITEDGMAIQGDASFSKDRYHHFGHYIQNPSTATPEQILRHDYDLLQIGAGIFNPTASKIGINYFAGIQFSSLADNLGSKEKNANIHLGATKWIKDRHSFGIELGSDFNTLKDSASQELNNFYLLPQVGIHGKSFQISAGVRVTSHQEDIGLFPAVNLSLSIAGNQLMAIAGADGGLNKNSYRTLSDYNPFISARPILSNNTFTSYFAGIKGSAKTIEYDGRVGYRQNNGLPLFVLNTTNFSRFDVIYRDIDLVHVTASVAFRPTKNIIINSVLNKNFYTANPEPKAWGLPSIEFNGSVQYQSLNQKLLFTAEAFVNDGIPYLDDLGHSGKSKVLLDISLGADYHLTKNIGLFVQANNLASNQWRRWYQYPTFGINAVGGITLKF